MSSVAPLSTQTPITDTDGKGSVLATVSTYFKQFIDGLVARLAATAEIVKVTTRTLQTAAIPTTAALTVTSSGLYRVSVVARVSRAATTNSSLQITLGWVRSGNAITKILAAETGNTTSTYSIVEVLIRADAANDITFAVAYASTGATPMQFEIDVVVEQVQ